MWARVKVDLCEKKSSKKRRVYSYNNVNSNDWYKILFAVRRYNFLRSSTWQRRTPTKNNLLRSLSCHQQKTTTKRWDYAHNCRYRLQNSYCTADSHFLARLSYLRRVKQRNEQVYSLWKQCFIISEVMFMFYWEWGWYDEIIILWVKQ